MARAQRIEYEGAVYHVTARGNERRAIFHDDADRERFLRMLGESVERFETRLYLFCLMTNHVHLVVETPRANLGQFMHRLETAYTVYFNRRHDRCGHLLQGRYGARLVEKDAYILRLSRYVHLNPVFAAAARRRPVRERVVMLREYRWSSYRSYIGRDRRLAFVDYDPILATVISGPARRTQAYRRFVESAIGQADEEFLEVKRASPLSLGSEGFRERILSLYHDLLDARDGRQDVAFRRRVAVLSPEEVLTVVCAGLGVERALLLRRRRNSFDRAVASRMLCRYAGLTQRQAAHVVGIRNGASVSGQLNRLAKELQSNRSLRNRVQKMEDDLKRRRNEC
ncbi:MAG TPA: transposase [Sedimentisphaerales bacterium]|nr:transposase [Sedimentisphaerales bacterium]